jgi:hypothetical protein
MTNPAAKVLEVADRITAMSANALSGLDIAMSKWPAEYRAIVWRAVADMATRRAEEAEKSS